MTSLFPFPKRKPAKKETRTTKGSMEKEVGVIPQEPLEKENEQRGVDKDRKKEEKRGRNQQQQEEQEEGRREARGRRKE